ncbi:two-component sensor histidine kinase [Arthrobacter sp. SW1]|uniref:sensor histidine kinase n=1 Tax=Arthrobacter sp. SW1 TaxID=1920889 RepID=UPI000877D645|nr:sensor histidine kinase [Arthrobacter sp. SW1]OFI38424.1 two-component sensor histidine kinase [Arthrobacter sp. SW1]
MTTADTRPERERQLNFAVHCGFALLMTASLIRYVFRHGPDENTMVLVLAGLLCGLYVTAVRSRGLSAAVATWVLVAVWTVLVVLAPSFAWCAFGVFFVCRSGVPARQAAVATAVTALSTALGLFKLSGFTDIAALLGPLAAGLVLTLVYERLETALSRQAALNDELREAQIQAVAAERAAGTMAERERVAREIHDTVTQGLASTVLLLEAADRKEGLSPEVRQATEQLRLNLAETRGLVHELATADAPEEPLETALATAVRKHVADMRVAVVGQPRELPAEVRHALLRIAQSAAANVLQHAHAQTASATLGYLPHSVTLDIYDDGRGFAPDATAGHTRDGGYGLRAMRQRVEQLGGTFAVESAPGEGTVIGVEIPLFHTAESEHSEAEGGLH